MKNLFKNLLEFIRLKICFFICSIALCGYLLFNPLGINLFFTFLASFFGTAGAYSLNNIKDKEEDLINRKSINPIVLSRFGFVITLACFFIGIFFSLFLPLLSIIFSILGIVSSLSYSCLKIKKYSLIKNIYTALGVGTAFLVGASYMNMEVMWSYLLFFFFIIIMSLISDLRDYAGDKKSNIRTLPVSIGYERVRKIIFILLGIFSIQVSFSSKLFAFLPFVLFMLYFLYKNKPSDAHSWGGFSFIFLTFWLYLCSL